MLLRNVSALVAIAAVLPACDPELDARPGAEDWVFPEWDRSNDGLEGLIATRDPAVQIFDGHNHVVDAPVGKNCVLPEAGALELAEFRAGGDAIATEIQYITNRDELERALDIDAQAKIKVGPLGGGASLAISRDFKHSDTSLAILLRSRHVYSVINQERHHITDDALAVLESDAARFFRECGTGYVAGVGYGAEFNLLIQIETHSLAKRDEIQHKLEAAGIKAGPASIDPTLGAAFSSALAQESLDVDVSLESRGFVPTVDLSALGKLDADAFTLAAEAHAQLRASVERDKCHDQGAAGPGECDDGPARGYLDNGARAAVPMGLLRLPFSRTANFPGDLETLDAVIDVELQADAAIATLESHARLYDAMVAIHNDEVDALLASDTPHDFSVYDTSESLRSEVSFAAMVEHAETWAAAYDPVDGTEVRRLAGMVAPCWKRAQFGDFASCLVAPEDAEGGAELFAAFAAYAEARVRPVHYDFAPEPHGFWDVVGKCDPGWREPTRAEASRLWFAVERNPSIPDCKETEAALKSGIGAWYDDQGRDCPADQGAYLERLPTGEFVNGCYADGGFLVNDMDLVVLCVPTSGPYGTHVADLPGR
jgi:hypothetical protein